MDQFPDERFTCPRNQNQSAEASARRFFYITVLWPESLQPSTLATFVWVASCRSGRELEKLGQAQDLKGAEDQELIQWINSPTNGSPAPATRSKRRGTSPALFLFNLALR